MMRKIKKALIFIMLTASGFASETYAVAIAADGIAKAVIVIGKDANEPERHAADELADFLGQVTGAKFEIANEASASNGNLFVGSQAAKMADANFSADGLGTDGIIIKTVGNNLILAGGKPRGTLYAVYTFLEDYAGCHWWAPGASTIPNKPALAIKDINIRYVPKLNCRDIIMPSAFNPDWSVRNKRIGIAPAPQYRAAAPARGGYLEFWPVLHSFFIVLPPAKYFKDYPEWYSLINGKRQAEPDIHASLCLTNQEMRRQFIANLIAEVKRMPDVTYAYIGNPDDAGYPFRCQCAECTSAEKTGSYTDLFVEFTNAVAEEFEKAYPNIPIALAAYHFTAPPKHTRPRHNVVVRLDNISNSFSVPVYHERNKEFCEDFIGWTKISPQIHIWTYVVDFTYELAPYPNLRSFGPDIKYYVDHGVSGITAEGWNSGSNGEMGELRAWLLAKLMWNPYQSDDALIKEFTDGYYGSAGQHIRAYLDVIHNAVEASGDWLDLSSSPTARFLTFQTLKKSWSYLIAAEDAVKDDKELLRRVKIAQLPVLYTFLARWNELRDKAICRGDLWPMPESREDVVKCFTQIVQENNIRDHDNSAYLPPGVN
ncbi:MAG: DUF4838 domain-containing protein [Sedimentisphaerales bacterium]